MFANEIANRKFLEMINGFDQYLATPSILSMPIREGLRNR